MCLMIYRVLAAEGVVRAANPPYSSLVIANEVTAQRPAKEAISAKHSHRSKRMTEDRGRGKAGSS